MPELELVRIPLSQIKPDPKNAKDHDVGLIIESFRRFGYVNPMVLNSDDFLLAGHGRRKALLAMQGDNDPPPKNIEAKDDEWIVPVGVGPDFDQREGTAYRLVDNRSTEVGGYDEPQLLENLIALSKNGGLEATGYDTEDVDRLFQLLNPNLEEVQTSDEAKKLQRKWKTKSGQLWEIGRHRLFCGDAERAEDISRLLDGNIPNLMVTDPPYGLGDAKSFNEDHPDYEDTESFDLQKLSISDQYIIWGGNYYEWLPEPRTRIGWIVWDKRPDLEGEKRERADRRFGQHFEIAITNVGPLRGKMYRQRWGGYYGDEEIQHKTQKPTELMAWCMKDVVGTIFDPFIGSGTTMVAAEQLNRICYGMEIEPKYVAVTLERMSTMGLEPELLS